MGRPTKWPPETVAAIRHGRFVEKRKIAWLGERYGVPIDTVRDWLYRGRRAEEAEPPEVSV